MWTDYADQGLVIIGAMTEDQSGAPADIDDAIAWCDQFAITHPMLADPEGTQMGYYVSGFPTYIIIDRDMVVANADLWPFDPQFVIDML